MVIAWNIVNGELNKSYAQRGYLAPTIFLLPKKNVGGWNYYNSFSNAVKKWNYLRGLAGGSNVAASGYIATVRNSPSAQTLGINVDFYIPQSPGQWVPIPYGAFRDYFTNTPADKFYCIAKIYRTNGEGPYYLLMDKSSMGISATSVSSTDPKKLAELDLFHREVQLLKYRYNSLVTFLITLSKKNLNAREQQIFNEGLLLKSNLENQIRAIKGIEITYGETGQINGIGVAPLLVIIVIAIVSAATAWTVYAIQTEREKTARINQAYDISKWVTQKMEQVAKDPGISPSDKSKILDTLNDTAGTANQVITQSSENSKSIFGEMGDILKYGVIAIIIFKAIDYIPKPKNN